MTETTEKKIYRFDDFVIDTQNFTVELDSQPVSLTPRAFDVLSLLLRNYGHVVEKRELFTEVWKDVFVTDNALTKVVKELRHALQDSADKPRYIETIPKRGYRFIGAVDNFDPAALNGVAHVAPSAYSTLRHITIIALIGVIVAVGSWIMFTDPGTASTPSTIAVLPFKPLDTASRDESLEFGMAETLITRLSNLRNVVVRPIGSVRKFSEPDHDPLAAGKELQADAVLDGTVQKSGDRVRVAVRLIDTRSGAALWSEQFDENFTDIFRVQDSIAQRITTVLALKLTRTEQEQLAKHMTENPEAYELYLRGQFLWHRRGPEWIEESLTAYKQALEKDPNFALAHIGVADAYIMLSGHRRVSIDEAEAHAIPSIARALEIDSTLPLAHNALAELKYQYQHDWRGAEAEFRTAIDLNPNIAWIRQAYGWFLMSEGRLDEANVEMEHARRLDPSSLTLSAARGRLLYFSRQYERATEHYVELLKQEPNDSSLHYALLLIYIQRRMYPEAVESFCKSTGAGMAEEKKRELREAFAAGGWEAFVRKLGDHVEKRRDTTGLELATSYAQMYLWLGDREHTLYWLEKLFENRDISLVQMKVEPAYDFVRGDPRFAEVMKKMGLEP